MNKWWGEFLGFKNKQHTRIFFQNIYGLKLTQTGIDLSKILVQADGTELDIIGLAETNVAWKRHQATTQLQNECTRLWQRAKTVAAGSTQYQQDTLKQYGGTALIVRGRWTSRCLGAKTDETLGRWSILHFQGKNNKKLSIICAYLVCSKPISKCGPQTAAFQQWSLLHQQNEDHEHPRERFYTDLSVKVQQLKEQNHEILLMLDANESTSSQHSKTAKFFDNHGLINIMRSQHQEQTAGHMPAKHMRGSQPIDFMAATPALTNFIEKSGMTPFKAVFDSDHRGLWIDINLQAFLQQKP